MSHLDRKEEKKQSPKHKPKVYEPMLDNSTSYAITINPKNQFEESSSRYIDVYSSLVTFLKKHNHTDYAELHICTEVSYPLKNGLEKRKSSEVISRIHFHGVIKFISVVHWFMYVQPFLAGFCIYEIDTIDDMDTWNSYITKDRVQWLIVDIPFTEYCITDSVILSSKVKKKKQKEWDNGVPIINNDNAPFYTERDDIITQLNRIDGDKTPKYPWVSKEGTLIQDS